MSFWFDLLGIIIALITVYITYSKWSYKYWKRKNVPYLEPKIPFGNLEKPHKRTMNMGVYIKTIYDQIKSANSKYFGIYSFMRPLFIPTDLNLVKNIMTKDFQHFVDRGVYYNEKEEPISAHLFAIGGVKWRNLRAKLTPTFTSGKMKMMFQTLVDCGSVLQKMMENKYDKQNPIDIKEVLGCFTTDIIGSCAFGLECNTFKNENSPFRVYGKKAFEQDSKRALLSAIAFNFPSIGKLLHIRAMPKEVSDFFTKIVYQTVDYREKNNIIRKDFLQLLIELKNNKIAEESGYQHDGKTLTLDEVVAQSFVFFLAGFETSSTTMTFVLYELAKNQDIQDKVRNEIGAVLNKHKQITYDSINDMKYMNQVIDETLRLYPPVPIITRICVEDYPIPDSSVIIEKNTRILIPVYAIHHDKKYYPDPEKFDPDRFDEKNKETRHHYAHIPFGEGPRICIGLRFGLMQTKVGLTVLLRDYKFSVHSRTKQPLKMSPKSFVLSTDGGIWLNMEKI